MPKPGYFSSIDALNRWYFSVDDKPETLSLKTDNDKGTLLLRVKASDKKAAWDTIEKTLKDYGSGLFWISLGVGSGTGFSNRETGLDLSSGTASSNTATVGIGGIAAGMDMDSYRKLMTYQIKEELGIQAAKNTGFLGAIAESLKNDPGVGKELVTGVKDLVTGIMGMAMSFAMPNANNSQSQQGEGVAIAGTRGQTAKLDTQHFDKPGEIIIDCPSFTLENRGAKDVLFNGKVLPAGAIVSPPYMQGIPYYQKISLSGEDMNVFLYYTEIQSA